MQESHAVNVFTILFQHTTSNGWEFHIHFFFLSIVTFSDDLCESCWPATARNHPTDHATQHKKLVNLEQQIPIPKDLTFKIKSGTLQEVLPLFQSENLCKLSRSTPHHHGAASARVRDLFFSHYPKKNKKASIMPRNRFWLVRFNWGVGYGREENKN